MRSLLVSILLLAACSKHGSSNGPLSSICEHARDQALENQKFYVAEVMADATDEDKQAIQAQSDRELANLEAKFVDACMAASDFKPECFVNPEAERSPACKDFLEPFWRKTLR